jgi:hypothetical protein
MTISEVEETPGERQRKVRFHGRVQFKTIRHVADFSEDEISDGWYRKNDFIRMSDEVAEIAKLLADGKEFHQGEELCIRGLEHLVEEDVADYRAEKMIASIDAVLDEQDDQAEEDIYDPDIIAKIYGEIVSPLLREAYLVGLRDAKEGAAAAASIPDLEETPALIEDKHMLTPQMTTTTETVTVASEPQKEKDQHQDPIDDFYDEQNKEEYADLSPISSHGDDESDNNEGLLKLNTSLNSIGTEVHIEKKLLPQTKRTSPDKKGLKKQSTPGSKTETIPKSPTRKNLRRKTFNRKGGTELSPFVFRRDGTIKFRNFDVEHRKREQSKMRKECIKDSMFKFLEDDDGGDDISEFISKSSPRKKTKKPAVGLKGSSHQRKS